MKKLNKGLFIAFLAILLICFSIASCINRETSRNQLIRLNQVGFYPLEEKNAVVVSNNTSGRFIIREATTGKEVLSGELPTPRSSKISDKQTIVLTFSELTTPGEYIIELPSIKQSCSFTIKPQVLRHVTEAAIKGFYYQRMGIPIEVKYAGKWPRPLGHPDTKVMIHPSAVSPGRPEGTLIESTKGWYDAGDYNKYIVNSGFTVSVLLSLFEDYPDYVKQLTVNIPESMNSTPDLLDEVYWNLSWMLTMQDPEDGGLYHKLTTPSFEGFIKPENCKKQRYVVAKSVTASLDFAASMAQASRIYADYEEDYPEASSYMLQAARRAFDWALKNPDVLYRQNEMNKTYKPEISTGEYGDRNASDEFFWAAAELYITTGEETYLNVLNQYLPEKYVIPVWGNVAGLGNLALIRHAEQLNNKELTNHMKSQLVTYADSSLLDYQSASYAAPYGRVAKDFFWGCNSDGASNQGMTFLYAWQLTKDKKYLTAALNNMDYILGRNATGYCYVTGFGCKSPMNPHHRLSASDKIKEPIPGLLIGGPNPGKQDGCVYPSDIPDECYVDIEPSYASNEIAINWQGLFTYFAGALDACLSD